MSTTFNDWIMQAQIIDDPAGDFIDDTQTVIRANRHPPPVIDNMDQLRSYLRLRGACHEAIATVPVVWKRYRRWFDRVNKVKGCAAMTSNGGTHED